MADCEDLINSAALDSELKEELMEAVEQGDTEMFESLLNRAKKGYDAKEMALENRIKKRAELEKYHAERAAGAKNPAKERQKSFEDEFSGKGYRSRGKGTSLDTDISSYKGRLMIAAMDLMESIKPKFMRPRQTERLQRATMKAYYEGTEGLSKGADAVSKQAELAAKSLQKLDDEMYKLKTDMGIEVTYREKYGIPIKHDPAKMEAMGEESWVKLVQDSGMADTVIPTPTQAAKGVTRESILRKMYNSITSYEVIQDEDLLNKVLGTGYRKPYMKERILQPTSGDGMMDYMNAAGAADNIYDAMVRKIDMVSRELAATRKFGIDYDSNVKWLANQVGKAAKNPKVANTGIAMWERLMNRALPGESTLLVNLLGDVRALMVITKLPATVITAVSDVNFTSTVTFMHGYKPLIRFQRNLAKLKPGSKSDRYTAGKLGLVVDDGMRYLANSTDWKAMNAHRGFKQAANMSTNISLLSPWTQMMKRAAGLDILANVGAVSDPKGQFLKTLQRYGISTEEYKVLQDGLTTISGVKFVDVNSPKIPDDLKIKVLSMAHSEINLMVPEMGVKAAAIITGRAKVGSGKEAVFSTLTQFQGFGVSQFFTHMVRTLDGFAQRGSSALYGPTLLVGGMMMGHISLSLNEINKGNDPRKLILPDGSMDKEYLMECFLKSGLVGPLGDYILTDPTLWGGLAKRAVGPGLGTAIDAFTMIAGPWHDAEASAESIFKEIYPAGLLSAAEKNAFFTRLPVARAAWDHTVSKFMHQSIDPRYWDKRSQVDQRMSDQGRGRFLEEQRMPDINLFQ